ncbi:MAG: nuclear transport factor 2 family protein [Actinomycetota bacterium]|nr:nuclear transport factor 2 family protein [Actinomycetota bacterium]
MNLSEISEQFRSAANEFARGNPEPVKALFSHRGDVTLANPFGPAVRGWEHVAEALDYASSRFKDGAVTSFERVAEYIGDDLACLLEVERWQAKVGGREDTATFDLRVTSTFRHENGTWKLVHRHADPITTHDPAGPLRGTSA